MRKDVIADHYRRIAEHYTDYLSYSEDFVPTLATKMVEMLDLDEDDTLVDLGGGSGIFSAAILDQVELRDPVILVDPFAAMLERVPDDLPVEKVHKDGTAFVSEDNRRYDKVLIKETVHHIDDREHLLRSIHDRLEPGGAVLLVHVPPELDYPLFDAALDRARSWHADPDELERLLVTSGFRTQRDSVTWEHVVPKDRYLEMVQRRYMSVLSSFSDDEIRVGIEEMERTHAEVDELTFTDHFDYIAGHKA